MRTSLLEYLVLSVGKLRKPQIIRDVDNIRILGSELDSIDVEYHYSYGEQSDPVPGSPHSLRYDPFERFSLYFCLMFNHSNITFLGQC